MDEKKKDAALDEDVLEGVTGGAGQQEEGVNQPWDRVLGRRRSDADDNKAKSVKS